MSARDEELNKMLRRFFPGAGLVPTWGIEVLFTEVLGIDDDREARFVEITVDSLPEPPGEWEVVAVAEVARQLLLATGARYGQPNVRVLRNMTDAERDGML